MTWPGQHIWLKPGETLSPLTDVFCAHCHHQLNAEEVIQWCQEDPVTKEISGDCRRCLTDNSIRRIAA